MRPVSARFLRTLTGSHTAAFRARVVEPGQTGVNPAGTQVEILDGDVRLDGGAAIRSTVQVEVDGTGRWPNQADSLLAPYGVELFVERGIAYGGGSTEWVSLGYHRINEVDQDDAPDGPIQVAAADRMANIIDAKLTSVVQFAATDTYGNVVQQLVIDAYPAAVIEWDDDDVAGDALGRAVLAEDDRYAFLDDLIVSRSKIWHFDHRGILVIRTPPAAGYPVWAVARGAGGVLVKASRSLSRTGVYNGVVAIGEALDTEPPARGLAVDADPGSPTFWGGPFGKVPREFSSPLLKTDGQAQLAAATILRRSLGLPYNVDLSVVPNPALEPDDPVAIGLAGFPTANPPQVLVGDSFARTVVDGMGVSESGHTWTGGAPTSFQVNAGELKVSIAANSLVIPLNDVAAGRLDTDHQVDYMLPAVATGESLVTAITARYLTGSPADYLMLRLDFDIAGRVSLRVARWQQGVFSTVAELGQFAAYAAGQWWRLRGRLRGALAEMKAWPRDTPEPADWMLTTDVTGTSGVRSGLYLWRVNGNTNAGPQWHVDNWRTTTVPGQPLSGGEVHVIDTLTIPLTVDGVMSATTREQSLVTIGEA